MLDTSYELLDALPPPLIPAAEFEKLIAFLRTWQITLSSAPRVRQTCPALTFPTLIPRQKPDPTALADEELGQHPFFSSLALLALRRAVLTSAMPLQV
eukprot:3933011-Rhodomonas_salina.1